MYVKDATFGGRFYNLAFYPIGIELVLTCLLMCLGITIVCNKCNIFFLIKCIFLLITSI